MRIISGKIQTLPVFDTNNRGYLLGDDHQTILLPKWEVKEELNEGDEVEVFVFYNEETELEATTEKPQIQVGEMICIKAANTNTMGAFVKIGTKRDILIPTKEQRVPIETGQMVLMILRDDPSTRRLYGSTRISSSLLNKDLPYKRGDEVELMIAEAIEVGRRVVVNGKHFAALFEQEITHKLRFGEKVKGYVRQIEGKDLVVSMQKEGLELLEDAKGKIMEYLRLNGGYARIHDDTDPEEIKLRLRMSKKTFKKAAGMLFKEGKVILTKLGIKLNNSGEIPKEWKNTKLNEEPLEKSTRPKASKQEPGNENAEETPTRKPRKEFVDKRNYKGHVKEFDTRGSSSPRVKRERISNEEKEERTEKKTYTPKPATHRVEKPARDQSEERPATREAPERRENSDPPPSRPPRILKRRDEPGADKK